MACTIDYFVGHRALCFASFRLCQDRCANHDEAAETQPINTTKGMNQSDDRGERTADNIRYGQNISESGQGGMTKGMEGTANDGGKW